MLVTEEVTVTTSVEVVVVKVVVASVLMTLVVAVKLSTSVDVVVVSVIIVVAAGVNVEVVVDFPIFSKLLQKEVAGALSPDRTDRTLATPLHTPSTLIAGGPGFDGVRVSDCLEAEAHRSKRRNPNGIAEDGAA